MTPAETAAREWARKAAEILEESDMEYMVMVFPNDKSVLTKAKATKEQLFIAADKTTRELARATNTDRGAVLLAMMAGNDSLVNEHINLRRVK